MNDAELRNIIQAAAEQNATELNLSYNELTSLPPEIGQLTNLTELNLMGNQLTSLPPEITQLTNLTTLNLGDNQLTSLPPEIGRLTNLTTLALSNNQLTSLIPEIFLLKNLIQLNINSNRLISLPPEIGLLTNLAGLHLGIDFFRNSMILAARKAAFNRRSEAYIFLRQGNILLTIPSEINQLINLSTLDLSGRRLTNLSPEVFQLIHLTHLNLSFNYLTYLSPEIVQLKNLTNLNLTGNELRNLPPEVYQLTKLKELSLSDNYITTLPPEVGQLNNLIGLDLSCNQLTSIPLEICYLSSLTKLDLSHNKLASVPPEISQLTKLTLLNLNDNQLTNLPPKISQLENLEIAIDDNPFNDYSPEIVEQGVTAILTYLKELAAGHQQQWLSKLVLVGEGGVGKTCLLRALRGEDFQDSPTTRGIEIQSLQLPYPSEDDVILTLNAWDFGGQEIYHATHQFFLTNRSLFLLVWNARHGYEQGKLYYWLDAIQARAPESPVLVIAAWTDERDADLPLADLQKKYPQIKGFYNVSNKTGQGIAELKQAIADCAATCLPLMGEKWPTSWMEAAEAIRAHLEKHIPPNTLWEIMREHNVSEAGMRVLARWLHELGDILFFRDERELNDIVILKPEWVNEYIARVLESEDVIGKDGIFTDEHMAQLWSDLEPSLRSHFLRLMETFDLSYRTLEKEEVSLVVERLPLEKADYQALWDKNQLEPSQHEISMKFKLNTLLPGLPTWFIARSHRFTTHTHWRMGAVFAYEQEQKHLALVQAFPHERYLQLSVRGPSPHNFFALLKDGLEVTLARYPGLKIERTIPCPGHDDQPCEYEFNYENLQKAIERDQPVKYVQCQASFENIPVSQLLFGLHWRTQDEVIEELSKKMDAQHAELVTLLQREFAKQFRIEQSQLETYCPNVFVLRPVNASAWKRVFTGDKLELQLYCQAPGCWHPTKEGGHYEFDYPPKWLRALGPYIKDMVTLLKFVTPLVGPWVGMADAAYAKLIEHDIKLMEGLVKILPEIVETRIDETDEMKMVDAYAEGAGLRAVRQLLDELDKGQAWGGLQRVLTPEGHYLWLCEYHAREYRK